MMSRLMLNLHEYACVGIFSTHAPYEDGVIFTSLHVTSITESNTQQDSDIEQGPVTVQRAHDTDDMLMKKW